MVSVIIINYNTYSITCNCIESILNYTKEIDFEIILVDNASHECNPNLFKLKFPDIILVESKQNLGFAKGNNLGISHAKGEVILLLNSDTYITENVIKKSMEKFLSLNSNTILSVQLRNIDNSIQASAQKFQSIFVQIVELLRFQKILPQSISSQLLLGAFFDHKSSRYVDWTWGTYFLFNKNMLTHFPENKLLETYFMYGEDMEWCWYIRKKYKAYYCTDTFIYHLGSASSTSKSTLNNTMRKNFLHFMKKNKGALYLKFYLLFENLLNFRFK